MGLRRALFVVLGEDDEHLNFAWHWLRRKGVDPRKIRKVAPPAGAGCGSQHVREKFPGEVESLRRLANVRATALIALTDADVMSVAARRASVTERAKPAAMEPIAILIPKREIETWVHHLLGSTPVANEETKFGPKTADDVRDAAHRLADSDAEVAAGLPSLADAIRELVLLKE